MCFSNLFMINEFLVVEIFLLLNRANDSSETGNEIRQAAV